MDREKLLDKIQKCLALGKSPNEHEAAAAMRQAQKMMDRNGVTHAELGMIGYGKETIHTSIQAGGRLPLILTSLANLMQHAFGVEWGINRSKRVSDYNFDVNYYGPKHRVMLAAYTHTVIWRAMDASYKQWQRENPAYKGARGGRSGFVLGWVQGVRDKIVAFGMTEEEDAATQLFIETTQGGPITEVKSKPQKLYAKAIQGGSAASKDFSINTPLNVDQLRIET